MTKAQEPAQAGISGIVWKEMKAYVIRTKGESKFNHLLTLASPGLRKFYHKKMLVTSVSPAHLLTEYYLAWKIGWPDHDGRAFQKMIEWVAGKTLDRVMTIFMIDATPHIMAMNFPKLWDSFFNYGHLIIREDHGHAVTFEVTGTEVYGEIACWLVSAWVKQAIIDVGGSEVAVNHNLCRQANHNQCLFEVKWETQKGNRKEED